VFSLALGEHGREGADVSGEGIGFGVVRPSNTETAGPLLPRAYTHSQAATPERTTTPETANLLRGVVAGFDVDAFALGAEDAEEFHGVSVGVAEPVGEVGVEFRDFAVGEGEVLVAEYDA
jgi:hypothetical protein